MKKSMLNVSTSLISLAPMAIAGPVGGPYHMLSGWPSGPTSRPHIDCHAIMAQTVPI